MSDTFEIVMRRGFYGVLKDNQLNVVNVRTVILKYSLD